MPSQPPSQAFEPAPTQNRSLSGQPAQGVAVQKIPFHRPQIGSLRHVLQETGEGGKSKEYDSYHSKRS